MTVGFFLCAFPWKFRAKNFRPGTYSRCFFTRTGCFCRRFFLWGCFLGAPRELVSRWIFFLAYFSLLCFLWSFSWKLFGEDFPVAYFLVTFFSRSFSQQGFSWVFVSEAFLRKWFPSGEFTRQKVNKKNYSGNYFSSFKKLLHSEFFSCNLFFVRAFCRSIFCRSLPVHCLASFLSKAFCWKLFVVCFLSGNFWRREILFRAFRQEFPFCGPFFARRSFFRSAFSCGVFQIFPESFFLGSFFPGNFFRVIFSGAFLEPIFLLITSFYVLWRSYGDLTELFPHVSEKKSTKLFPRNLLL